jgi:hypothetical protein
MRAGHEVKVSVRIQINQIESAYPPFGIGRIVIVEDLFDAATAGHIGESSGWKRGLAMNWQGRRHDQHQFQETFSTQHGLLLGGNSLGTVPVDIITFLSLQRSTIASGQSSIKSSLTRILNVLFAMVSD